MSLFLETIRFENGRFDNLPLHRQRMETAIAEVFGKKQPVPPLERVLQQALKTLSLEKNQLYKCRVVYGRKIEEATFRRYSFPQIESLKLVENNEIDYHLKRLDRKALNALHRQRGACDDVLIVKNGLITDTTFANVVFFDGSRWFTPAVPLLEGTRRQQLLQQGIIQTAEIRPRDLSNFSKARLINAMMRFEDGRDVDINRISG